MTHEEWQLSTTGRFIDSKSAWDTAQREALNDGIRAIDALYKYNATVCGIQAAAALHTLKDKLHHAK